MNSNSNEPIVLGELKKEKSSKPFFALLVFTLVLATCFGLPYIQDYIVNGNGPIAEFYNKIIGNEITTNNIESNEPTTTKTVILDPSLIELKSDTILNINDIYLQNISIKSSTISYRIMARTSYNLDDLYYYLEVYDNKGVLLTRIKLTGNVSTASITKTNNVTIKNLDKYYVKVINSENESLEELNVNN